jgi:hypothetical protein
MSEILHTERVEAVEVPSAEPLISLSDVLTGLGWLAFQGTKLAVMTAVGGGVLAYRGVRAAVNTIQEAKRLSLPEIERTITQAPDAKAALQRLASSPGISLPQGDAAALEARVQKLVAADDKLGVASLAREIVRGHQDRLQTTLLTLTVESCREIGFDAVTLRADHGILIAKNPNGRSSITIEVEKAKDGDVRLHFDADGFHGGACVEALDALRARLAAKGVRFHVGSRRRKDQRPAFDGRRIARPVQVRAR